MRLRCAGGEWKVDVDCRWREIKGRQSGVNGGGVSGREKWNDRSERE